MVGVITPDRLWYCADALFGEETTHVMQTFAIPPTVPQQALTDTVVRTYVAYLQAARSRSPDR